MNRVLQFNSVLKARKFLWYVIGAIFLINIGIYGFTEKIVLEDEVGTYSRKDASGFSHFYAQKFIYFYYYTGDFPLATLNENLQYSKEGAQAEISQNGDSLLNEYKHWSRLGESARILAYLPNAWLKGSPENPSIKLFNVLVFVISLIICYHGFWKVGKPLLGLILVISVNLTPFFIYEIFANQNVFGLMGALFIAVLGVNLPLLYSHNYSFKNKLVNVVILAAVLAFFTEIRNELTLVFLAMLFMIFVFDLSKRKLVGNVALVLLACMVFLGLKKGLQSYFNWKFVNAIELVKEKGGHPYMGDRIPGHMFWHPIFCGLGDHDTKYGYEWNDRVAYEYAVPILNDKYHMELSYSGKLHLDDYYDSAHLYYKKFDEIPNYEQVVKDKVINDVSNDPVWYLRIIFLRIINVLSFTIPLPFLGWLIIPLTIYLIRKKEWTLIKLLFASLPLSITSIIIFSGKGATFNSMFVYVMIVIVLDLIFTTYEKRPDR